MTLMEPGIMVIKVVLVVKGAIMGLTRLCDFLAVVVK